MHAEVMFRYLAEVESNSTTLGDHRTLGWVHCQRALMFFYLQKYALALGAQELACTDRLNPMAWPDRQINLACIAMKLYKSEPTQTYLLKKAEKSIEAIVDKLSSDFAKGMLVDEDLTELFKVRDELRGRVETRAAGRSESIDF